MIEELKVYRISCDCCGLSIQFTDTFKRRPQGWILKTEVKDQPYKHILETDVCPVCTAKEVPVCEGCGK